MGTCSLTTTTNPPPTPNSLFLASILLDGSGTPYSPVLTGRQYMQISDVNIQAVIPSNGVTPTPSTGDYAGTTTTVHGHIISVGSAPIVANNPHGTGINDIPGLATALTSQTPLVQEYAADTLSSGIVFESAANNYTTTYTPGMWPGSYPPKPSSTPGSIGLTPMDATQNKIVQIGKLSSDNLEILYINGYRVRCYTRLLYQIIHLLLYHLISFMSLS